jgi:hypothetical protein
MDPYIRPWENVLMRSGVYSSVFDIQLGKQLDHRKDLYIESCSISEKETSCQVQLFQDHETEVTVFKVEGGPEVCTLLSAELADQLEEVRVRYEIRDIDLSLNGNGGGSIFIVSPYYYEELVLLSLVHALEEAYAQHFDTTVKVTPDSIGAIVLTEQTVQAAQRAIDS